MNTRFKKRRKFFILIPIALFFLITAIVMALWNCILPDILHVSTITFWQAMGILILSKILFGGFHGFNKRKPSFGKSNLKSRIEHLSPEERERFREMWKQRCNGRSFFKKD